MVSSSAWLAAYAATGLARDVSADSDLALLATTDQSTTFTRIADRIARNAVPVVHSDTAVVLPDSALVAEDIAYDPTRHWFFVSSVHERKIISIDARGHAHDFIPSGQDGVWSILALALDPERLVLWATTSATPMGLGYVAADSGRSALLAYDIKSGRLLHRYDPPDGVPDHALGDMTLAPNGDVYVSDGRAGILYALRRGGDQTAQLV